MFIVTLRTLGNVNKFKLKKFHFDLTEGERKKVQRADEGEYLECLIKN